MARPNNAVALLTNATATGAAQSWDGGEAVLIAEGTFSAATVQLQYQTPQGTWINITGASATAASISSPVKVPQGNVRATVSGGTPAGLYAWLEYVGTP